MTPDQVRARVKRIDEAVQLYFDWLSAGGGGKPAAAIRQRLEDAIHGEPAYRRQRFPMFLAPRPARGPATWRQVNAALKNI